MRYPRLYNLRLKLRKLTSPIHIFCGLLIAALIVYFPEGAILLAVSLAFFEYWQWKEIGDTGAMDWWEIIAGFTVGMLIVLILRILGVV